MSRQNSLLAAAVLVIGLLVIGLSLGRNQITLASVDTGAVGNLNASKIDPLSGLTGDMRANHGKYDNVLTALYEQQLAGVTNGGNGQAAANRPDIPLYGPDSRMSNGNVLGSNQNEFQIAINPTNHLNAIGTSNDSGVAGVGIFVTADGGVTWTSHDANTYSVPAACCDPGVVFGSDGHAYVIILDTSPAVTYIIRSSDGGATWQGPSQVATPDRPNIASDPSNPLILYVTYSDLPATNRIKGYKSTDGGVTWGSSFFVGDTAPPAGYEQASQPEVASDGTLYVGYQQYTNSTTGCSAGVQNVLAKSTNGGATFTYTVVPIVQGGACSSAQAGRGIFCVNAGGSSFRSRSQFVVGIKPTDPSHVYVVYSGGDLDTAYTCASSNGFHSDILYRRSTDGGATFSAATKINTDAPGKDQYFPWMQVAPNGTLWAGWNDRREDPNDFVSRWYQASSTDEGATWSEAAVADVQTQPNTFIGDYHGLAAQNDRVLGMWFDSRISASGDAYTDPGGAGTATPTRTGTPPTSTGTATSTPGAATASPTSCGGSSSWTPGPTHTPARYAVQGALGNDGKFYIAGGQDLQNNPFADAARFNPTTNAWESIASMPVAAGQVSVGSFNGKVYVAGGYLGGTSITSTLQIYTIATNSWSFGASMPASVEAAAGTALNGKFYVVGGDDFNTTSLRTTYIYDIATNTWSTGALIPDTGGRTNTYGTNLNNLVYVFGGAVFNGSSNTAVDTLLSYNPGTNTWTTLPSAGTGGLGNYAAISPYGTGKLLATDGADSTFNPAPTTHIYDVASNTWSAGPTMGIPRLGHAQGTLNDGRIIVYAGENLGGSTPTVTETSELLSVAAGCASPTPGTPATTSTPTATGTCTSSAGVWTDVNHVPVNKGRAVGVNFGSSIYLFGGRPDNTTYTQDIYRYDLATDTWTLLTQQFPDAMSSNMGGGLLTFPEGQRIFIAGGSGTGSVATGRAVAFNPADGTFATKATWPAAPIRLPGGWAVYNNKFYVFGGYEPNVDMHSEIWAYDPTTNTWTQSAASLSLARGYIATEAMPDGKIYLAGGSQYNGGNLTDETIFEKFDPATSTITTGTPMLVALSNDQGYNVGGKFVVPTGGFTTSVTNVQVYDPSSNSWSSGPPTLFPVRNYAKGYGLNGSIHVIGGTADASAGTYYSYNQKLSPVTCGGTTPTVTATVTIPASTNTATRTATSPAASSTTTRTSTAVVTSVATTTSTATAGTPTATYTACPVQFTDVPNGSTFYPYIRCLACRGIVSGYQDGTFRPNNNVTRGQLSKIVANSAGFSENHTTQDFQDVPVGSNFYIWIERLYSRGIITGYPCGGPFEPCGPGNLPYFRPNANATRGQITKIDANAAGYNDPPVGQQFQDVPVGSTFYTYTYQLVTRGIMSGYPCSGPGEPCVPPGNLPYFRPNNNATRGQTAKIVANTFFPNCQTPSRPVDIKNAKNVGND